VKDLEDQYKSKVASLKEENDTLKVMIDEKLNKAKIKGSDAQHVRAQMAEEIVRVERSHALSEDSLK
jgi:hypothetical protein